MKKYLVIIIIFISYNAAFSQDKLIKDIDFDGVKDTVYVDAKTAEIVCRLSGLNFKKMKSKGSESSTENAGFKPTKNGFEYHSDWMRAGYSNQFRYNKTLKRIQLIGMSRYEFGNAANDGSGESSVNLLTGDYIGNWNYFDHLANNEKGKLVIIPTIKTKMIYKSIFLEDFSDATYYDYADKCSKLYEQAKAKTKKLRSNAKP
ncbi:MULTISPECIES: hypothetical protein [Pedobacter]|uniref:hypothetical protein n=1 Tax=Pedobacter TaxID=84567 RepID=UPI00122B2E4B|nr:MULTISPECIES: hypothetical protein [Pedobacter]RZL32185.1 MAG: hypothetical protein EOO96_14635 [Pedobacter sp.]